MSYSASLNLCIMSEEPSKNRTEHAKDDKTESTIVNGNVSKSASEQSSKSQPNTTMSTQQNTDARGNIHEKENISNMPCPGSKHRQAVNARIRKAALKKQKNKEAGDRLAKGRAAKAEREQAEHAVISVLRDRN
uniref:BZIP domain-containing protein n=1 Tax=Panagrellus redivivus TaxID=6233 RepID=A0A7E4ZRD9_PANRE